MNRIYQGRVSVVQKLKEGSKVEREDIPDGETDHSVGSNPDSDDDLP